MRLTGYGVWLCGICLAMAGAAAGQTPDAAQYAQFRNKVRQDMTTIPNYTCLETIERTHREPRARAFKPVDTVRVEVSMVAGKELFAWPGARHFEDRDVTSMVSGGAIGSGMFAMFARSLFVNGNGTRQYGGLDDLDGRAAVRYDFHLTLQESGLRITVGGASETVAAKGSFWFDPVSLDLVRLDVHGEQMPYSLHLAESVFRTDYARAHIGNADALLPKRSELTMAHFSGETNRNAIEFSACREYQSESTIRFDALPATEPQVPKPQVRAVDLPAGLVVPIELNTAIDSKTAAVGDTLHARVVQDVRYKGQLAVPRGALLTGHICRLDRGAAAARFAVGVEFSEVEWEGAHAAFYAELMDLDRKSAGTHKVATYFDGHANKVLIYGDTPGAGFFFMEGRRFRIEPGFDMVWRTLAPAAGADRQPL